jgi:hypothetical protein
MELQLHNFARLLLSTFILGFHSPSFSPTSEPMLQMYFIESLINENNASVKI